MICGIGALKIAFTKDVVNRIYHQVCGKSILRAVALLCCSYRENLLFLQHDFPGKKSIPNNILSIFIIDDRVHVW